jgi:hypothetical protein
MAMQTIPGREGLYAIDWDVLVRVCRSFVRAQAILSHSKVIEEKQLFGPDISWVEVDWDAVKRTVDRDAPVVCKAVQSAVLTSPVMAADYVRTIVEETKFYRDRFTETQTRCSRESMKAINASVDRGQKGVAALTAIRDLSADFVMVGATVLSGGTAAAAIGGGALLKGSYKWQDTKSFSAGLFTASTELLFAAIPLKLKTMGVVKDQIGRLVLAKVKAGVEVAKTVYIDHQTVTEGVVAGALKMNDPGLMVLAKSWLNDAPPRMKLLAVPVVAVIKLTRDRAVKSVQATVAPRASAATGAGFPAAAPKVTVPDAGHSILDAAPFDGCSVEDLGLCRLP